MRFHRIVLAAGLMLVASSSILAGESSWTLRVHGGFIESAGESRLSVDSGIVTTVDVGAGIGVGAEFRFSDRMGLEFSFMLAGLDFSSSVSGSPAAVQHTELAMMPLTVAVPFHFQTGRADFYVAPTFSLVRYADLEFRVSGSGLHSVVDEDSDAALGAAVGLDVPVGKGKWAFSAGLRYMRTGVEGTDVDPVIVTFGFAYRF